jgi:hypothetical protein
MASRLAERHGLQRSHHLVLSPRPQVGGERGFLRDLPGGGDAGPDRRKSHFRHGFDRCHHASCASSRGSRNSLRIGRLAGNTLDCVGESGRMPHRRNARRCCSECTGVALIVAVDVGKGGNPERRFGATFRAAA